MANKPKTKEESGLNIGKTIAIATEQKDQEIAKLQEKLSLSPWIFEMVGKIKSMIFTESQARCFKVLFLKKAKESKDYREVYGMDWVEFCKHVGISWRTADDWLKQLEPLTTEFSANFADFSGYDLNKIKYLARAKSANIADFTDTSIIHKGEEIPLTAGHADEVRAVFEDIKDELKKLREEHDQTKRTYERRLGEDRKHVEKLERTLSQFEKAAERKGISLEEDAFLKQMEMRRKAIDMHFVNLDPDNFVDAKEKNEFSPRMAAAYLSTLDYLRKEILAAYDTAVQIYGSPVTCPEKAWHPGMRLS